MKRYFSLRFYLDTLLRLRTFTVVVAIVSAASAVMSNIVHLMSYFTLALSGNKVSSLTYLGLLDVNSILPTLVCFVVPLMTVTAFSFLMKRSESDFYESLPVRRGAMLISGAAAVLSSVAAIIATSSLVGVLILTPCMGKTVEYAFLEGLLKSFGVLLAAILAIAGTAVAISVTGTVKSAVATAATLLFIPRMVLAIINNSVMALCPALVKGHVIPLFDNNYNILTALLLGNSGVLDNPWAYLYTALLAALYSALAFVLFGKRKSEFATHSFTSRFARHTVSSAIAVYVAMLGVYLLCIDQLLAVIAVFVFALAVGLYFAYELVTGRREKSFLSTLKAFPVMLCVVGILAATVFISSSVFGAYLPEADEIESVSLSSELPEDTYGFLTYDQYVTLRSDNVKLTDEESKRIVATALERGYDASASRDHISVILKIDTGIVTYRRVSLTPEEHARLSYLFAEDDEYKDLWMKVADGAESPVIYGAVDIEGEGAVRVLRAMESEIAEIGFEAWYSVYYGSYNEYNAGVDYLVRHGNVQYTVSIGIFEQMPKTYAVYLEELQKAAKTAYDSLRTSLTEAAEGKGEELNLYLSLYTQLDGYYIDTVITDDEYSEELVSELFALVSPKAPDYESDCSISISACGNGVYSENKYAEFGIPSEKIEAAKAFFKKYGYQ